MSPSPSNRELCSVLFAPVDGRFKCRICSKSRRGSTNGGFTNLVDHLHRAHRQSFMDEYEILAGRPDTLDGYVEVAVDAAAMNAYNWLDWVVMEHLPIATCEKPRTRKYTNLKDTSVKTLKLQLAAVESAVQARIKGCLAGKTVGLLLDAWTEASTHCVSVIAVTQSESDPTKADRFLLCFTPFEDESDMSTDAFIDLIDYLLDIYEISLSDLAFYVCDHASVNASLSRKTLVPMIGCASHRLQLAVARVLEPWKALLSKVSDLMLRLNSVKNRHKLRDAGALMPVLRNTTRWSSTFAMVKRFFELRDHLDRSDPKLVDVLLSAREELRLSEVFDALKKIESVSKHLQYASPDRELSLELVQKLFDGLGKEFPLMSEYLALDAKIVTSTLFVTGVIKVLEGREASLRAGETNALQRFARGDTDSSGDEEELSFAQRLLRASSKKKSKYVDLRWIPSTSNEVERLFSRAGDVLTSRRSSMNPTTLESLMILEYNRSLWDAALVAKALKGMTRSNKRQRVV